MASDLEVLTRLKLDASQFKAGVRGARKQLKATGQRMQSAGRGLTMGVTAPLTAAGGAAIKTASDFEAGMKRVAAMSGATGDELDAMREKALEVGRETHASAVQAAGGLTFLSKAGFSAQESISALEGVVDLAAAGKMDLARAGDIASNVLKGYGMQAAEIGRVNDVLAETATSTNSSIQGLGQAFSMAGPVAKSAGLGFEQTAALLGKMGDAGIQAGRAGRTLRMAISRLLNPSKQTQKRLDQLGVNVTDTQGRMRSMTAILGDLAEAGASTGDMMQIFGARAGPGMQVLLDEGQGALEGFQEQLEGSAGAAGKMADKQLEGLEGRLKVLTSSLEGLAIAIADTGLLDMVTGLVERVIGLVNRIAEANPKLLRFGVLIAGAAAALGPILIGMGILATTVGSLMGPLGLVVGALAGLGALAVKNFGLFKQVLSPLTQNAESFGGILKALPQVLENLVQKVPWKNLGKQALGMFETAVKGLAGVLTGSPWRKWGKHAGAMFQRAVEMIAGAIERFPWVEMVQFVEQMFRGAVDRMVGFIEGVDWASLGSTVSGMFRTAVQGLVTFITQVNWGALGKKVQAMFETAVGALVQFVRNIDWRGLGDDAQELAKRLVEKLVEFIKGVDWESVGETIGTALKVAAQAVIDLLKSVSLEDILNITKLVGILVVEVVKGVANLLKGFLSGIGLGGVIPGLAHGGIVRSETLARVGEAGPEAVIPLDRLDRMLANHGGGGGGGTVLDFTGSTFILEGIQDAEAFFEELERLRGEKLRRSGVTVP